MAGAAKNSQRSQNSFSSQQSAYHGKNKGETSPNLFNSYSRTIIKREATIHCSFISLHSDKTC